MDLDAGHIAELAGRPVSELTRRDVALGLLSVDPGDAIASLPVLRRRLLAAGNPMSAQYWAATESVLARLQEGIARAGDVRAWLEATGTEPASMIGLHVWDEPPERSHLQADLHGRLVRHLEDRLAAGDLDPDPLVTGDTEAQRAWTGLQEQWMTTPLPDGRVPMDVLLDEKDAEFLAEWAAADSEALTALQAVLDEVDDRPAPAGDLADACETARAAITRPGLTGRLLTACGGTGDGTGHQGLPGPDADLWLTLATGIVSPAGEADPAQPGDGPDPDGTGLGDIDPDGTGLEESGLDDEADEVSRAIGALCALEHIDWLAAVAALARGGPGTPAAPADLARYVRDYCEAVARPGPRIRLADITDPPAGAGSSGDVDEAAIAELFGHVVILWRTLGAVDADQRLTALGWWGLPEALCKVWAPATPLR